MTIQKKRLVRRRDVSTGLIWSGATCEVDGASEEVLSPISEAPSATLSIGSVPHILRVTVIGSTSCLNPLAAGGATYSHVVSLPVKEVNSNG